MLLTSKSPSANARVASAALAIFLALADETLAAAIRRALRGNFEFIEVGRELATIVVTDNPAHDYGRGVLVVSAEAHGRNVLANRDPVLVLAAAKLIAAGYSIDRPEEASIERLFERVHLSNREQQVAALLLEGASNKLIARALDISVHTAKFHVTAVLEKVGARNRADAVAIILREGLIAL
jgi:DNA-binding NarL/FixJ family response regulator